MNTQLPKMEPCCRDGYDCYKWLNGECKGEDYSKYKNMKSQLPKEIEQFIKDEAEKATFNLPDTKAWGHCISYRDGFEDGATFMHTHLGEQKKISPKDAKELAVLFHDTYERLAPSFGYETRKETRQFDTETPNGKLMIAVCSEISSTFSESHEKEIAELKEENEKLKKGIVDSVLPEMMELVPQRIKILESQLKSLTQQHEQEIKELKDGLNANDPMKELLRKEISDQNKEISKLTAKIKSLTESHEKEIAELNEEINEYSRNLKNANELLNRRVSYSASLTEQHEQEMRELKFQYGQLDAYLKTISESHEKEIAELKDESEALRKQLTEERKELKSLTQQHEQEIKELHDEFNEYSRGFKKQIKSLTEQHEKEVKALEDKLWRITKTAKDRGITTSEIIEIYNELNP